MIRPTQLLLYPYQNQDKFTAFRNPYSSVTRRTYHGWCERESCYSESTIEEIELEDPEIDELDRIAEETRKCGISWEDLKAELGL
jgi:hypothetical protein